MKPDHASARGDADDVLSGDLDECGLSWAFVLNLAAAYIERDDENKALREAFRQVAADAAAQFGYGVPGRFRALLAKEGGTE